LLTVKQVIKDLEKLKEEYDNLRANIADDFNDDWIDKALVKVEKLKELQKAIEQMENLKVQTWLTKQLVNITEQYEVLIRKKMNSKTNKHSKVI